MTLFDELATWTMCTAVRHVTGRVGGFLVRHRHGDPLGLLLLVPSFPATRMRGPVADTGESRTAIVFTEASRRPVMRRSASEFLAPGRLEHVMLDNLRMLVRFLWIFATADPDTRVRRLYEARSPKHGFANRATRYVNFGYWTDDTTTRDEASERLAMKLAEAAGFTPDDVILDVGFGYGDQDFSWLKQRKIRQVY